MSTMQIHGAFLLLRHSFYTMRFVAQWLTYCEDVRIITDVPSSACPRMKEAEGFRENRHDQTVLSLLAKKWNIPTWPEPFMKIWSVIPIIPAYNRFLVENYKLPIWPIVENNIL